VNIKLYYHDSCRSNGDYLSIEQKVEYIIYVEHLLSIRPRVEYIINVAAKGEYVHAYMY